MVIVLAENADDPVKPNYLDHYWAVVVERSRSLLIRF